MSDSDFHILAKLYDFLSQFKAADIAAASRRRSIPANLRLALESLAKEANEWGNDKKRPSPVDSRKKSNMESENRVPKSFTVALRNNLKSFLTDAKRFPDKATLAQFAQRVGAPEAADPKYSRERVAHAIAQRAATDDPFRAKLTKIISNIADGDPQSKGWMDLILGK